MQLDVSVNKFVTEFYEFQTDGYKNKKYLLEKIKKLEFNKSKNLSTTFKNYKNIIFENKDFKEFKDFICKNIEAVLSDATNKKQFEMISSWFQIYSKNQFHDFHAHGTHENYYSCIYYVNAGKKSANTVFAFPGYPYIEISKTFHILSKTGKMVLFPSYIPHYVEPNQDTSRVIFSCNIHAI